MDDFLTSYRDKLRQEQHRFTEEQLQTVLSAVALLLRRHSTDNRLCSRPTCHNNNENYLEVTDIDKLGFVTQVR